MSGIDKMRVARLVITQVVLLGLSLLLGLLLVRTFRPN
jgi:hypothetical protein